jgi:acetyl-CoA carboxylase carboxyl transferase subunit alpha
MASEAELRLRERLSKLKSIGLLGGTRLSGELERLQKQLDRITAEPSEDEIWRSVELARHQDRPYTLDYVERLLDDWVELHGDRGRADDAAIVAGLGKLDGRTVVLVGHQKGRDVKERTKRNFGMAYPEGYRKAMRVMKLADRFGFPVVTLVDTPGAYPGVAAEQHGQGGAIAASQATMLRLGVPIVSVVIGEGGSGGALGIGVGDRAAMFQHSFYSVISPEGCAAILWKTADRRKHAAEALRLTAKELAKLRLVDEIIPEPVGGAHRDPASAAANLETYITAALSDLQRINASTLVSMRRDRIRQLGSFYDSPSETKARAEAQPSGSRSATSRALRLGARAARAATTATS